MKKSSAFVLLLSLATVLFFGIEVYKFLNTPIRQTKDYNSIYIEEWYEFTADDMISPPERFNALLQIDEELRAQVAKYMLDHNYKLKSGNQEFIRINPTFEELVENCFIFEVIE